MESLESRRLLAAEGELFELDRSLDTAGLVGDVSAQVSWGDGTASAAQVRGASSGGPLRVVFDYSLDSSGFFASSARRQVLQAAADSLVSRFTDDLAAISPSGSNVWSPAVLHPRTQAAHSLPSSLSIPANQIRLYVGARDLPGRQLGEGATGYFTSARGSQAWLDTVRARGERGALSSSPTDLGPWGGSLAFDEPRDWYFGLDADGIGANQHDFFSVAVHEIAHVLGFGIVYPGATQSSWEVLVSGGVFTGAKARASYGQNVPLASNSHWQAELQSGGRETAMDPTLSTGERKLLTPLDLAAMDDIGWSVQDTRVDVEAQHRYGDDGSYPVQVVLSGSRGGQIAYDLAATITNVAPTLSLAEPQNAVAGQPLSITDLVSISDPGYRVNTATPPTAETFEVEVDWGDGTPVETFAATIDRQGSATRPTLASLDAAHTFQTAGTYSVSVTVRDDDGGRTSGRLPVTVSAPPSLRLRLDSATIREDAGAAATVLTVTRSGPVLTTAETIRLSSSDRGEATLPASVVIAAGEDSVAVPVSAIDDALLDGDQRVTLSAEGGGMDPAAVDLIVRDAESLTAGWNQTSVDEDAAASSLLLTITRSNTDRAQALAVEVTGGDADQLVLPDPLVIPAGRASVTVPVMVVDDRQSERPETLAYTFTAAGYISATASIEVVDDDPPVFQNSSNAFDVNNDGRVEPYDLLLLINALNRNGVRQLDPAVDPLDDRYIDVSGDYEFTPYDASLLNNELNRLTRLRR